MESGHDPNAPRKQPFGVSIPPDVKSWWAATGKSLIPNHGPQTVTMPPSVFSWWEDTGSAFFATKFDPHLVLTTANPPSPPNPANSLRPTGKPGGIPPVTGSISPSPPTDSKSAKSPDGPTSGSNSLSVTQASPLPSSSPAASPVGASSPSSSSDTFTLTSESTSLTPLSSDAASSTAMPSSPTPINAASNKQTARIIAGVVVPLVLIFIGVAAFIIYKRRQRARDRREWERTHDAIADAVRRVGGTPAPGLPTWRPPYNDVKAPPEGDTAPLFEKSGDPSLPGPLEHTGGEFHSGSPSSLV